MGDGALECVKTNCTAFFTNKDSQFVRAIKSAGFRDKIAKFLVPTMQAVGEIASAAGADEKTLTGLENAREVTKTYRDISSMFNVFTGKIPEVVNSVPKQIGLARGLAEKDKPVSLKNGELKETVVWTQDNFHKYAANGGEKALKLLSEASGFVGNATYAFSFLICRPIQNIQKYEIADLGDHARNLGNSFQTLMFISNVGGFVQQVSEISFLGLAYRRAKKDITNFAEAGEEFAKKVVMAIVGLVDKILRLFLDVVRMAEWAFPLAAKIPVQLSIAGIGLWKAWQKAEQKDEKG